MLLCQNLLYDVMFNFVNKMQELKKGDNQHIMIPLGGGKLTEEENYNVGEYFPLMQWLVFPRS